jgi:hypothetical protein
LVQGLIDQQAQSRGTARITVIARWLIPASQGGVTWLKLVFNAGALTALSRRMSASSSGVSAWRM